MFERRILTVPYRSGTTQVPIHLFRRHLAGRQPLLLLMALGTARLLLPPMRQ
ncbi:MAG: hypothetical protein H7338_08205 [Candidatus Sericytochromatia bacterium]|nr:hypothetical protein [Candidatus Sericytochromatia bacterium]